MNSKVERVLVIAICVAAFGGCAAGTPIGGRRRDAGAAADTGTSPGTDGGRAPSDVGRTDAPGRRDTERCDGLDDDLDGSVDEMCPCEVPASQDCYVGDPALAGVGACTMGSQSCRADGEFSTWALCMGSGAPGMETCANAIDDDCDGMVDEGCTCLDTGGTAPWQQVLDRSVHCFGADLDMNPREFDFASIPSETSGAWSPRTLESIDFDDESFVTGEFCAPRLSHDGGIFSYFQTFVTLTTVPRTATLTIGSPIDDGAQVHVCSSGGGCGGGDLVGTTFTGGVTYDLRPFLGVGRNRVVVTHIDDNPTGRTLSGVRIEIDGRALRSCR